MICSDLLSSAVFRQTQDSSGTSTRMYGGMNLPHLHTENLTTQQDFFTTQQHLHNTTQHTKNSQHNINLSQHNTKLSQHNKNFSTNNFYKKYLQNKVWFKIGTGNSTSVVLWPVGKLLCCGKCCCVVKNSCCVVRFSVWRCGRFMPP